LKDIRLSFFKSFVFIIVISFSELLFATEQLLCTWHWDVEGGGTSQIVSEAPLYLWTNPFPFPPHSAFISWIISEDDVGDTFFSDAESDPGFMSVVDYLTNGQLDCFGIEFLGGGHSLPEDTLTDAAGIPQCDFYGYDITRIGLTVHDLTFDTPGSNPNGDGIWTDYSYEVSTSFYGIPEPSTLLLLALGAVMVRKRH
jgi:hypothetical protein